MAEYKPDKNPDVEAAADRGERIALMEPLILGEGSPHRAELTDLALELAQRSAGFRRSLPASLMSSLATLVRAMNCYYSNLIEGHDTHPIDIERAMQGDYSGDTKKRDLQLEARAHITVQQWIDEGGLQGRTVTADAIREIHRRFCAELPEDLLSVENPDTHERMQIIPAHCATVMSGSAVTSQSARRQSRAFSRVSRRSMAALARPRPSLRPRPRTTGWPGYIRSLTAMAAWRG